jgi:hypothetical protein
MSIDTDDVDLNLLDAVNRNECIYCSVSSYSTASLQVATKRVTVTATRVGEVGGRRNGRWRWRQER